jgi:hypothetical protein
MTSPRQLAKLTGAPFFLTGRYCNRGHNAPRYTSTGHCVQCQRANVGPEPVERRTYSGPPHLLEAMDAFWLALLSQSGLPPLREPGPVSKEALDT